MSNAECRRSPFTPPERMCETRSSITGIVNVRDPIRRSVPYRRIGKISMAGIR
jgi:hypothetical protein